MFQGPSAPGVQVLLGPSVFGVQVNLRSIYGQGSSVPRVQMSLGSKCARSSSNFGVQMGVWNVIYDMLCDSKLKRPSPASNSKAVTDDERVCAAWWSWQDPFDVFTLSLHAPIIQMIYGSLMLAWLGTPLSDHVLYLCTDPNPISWSDSLITHHGSI